MDYPKRKHVRLKNYDYHGPGSYFITICTQDKKHTLSCIFIAENQIKNVLTEYGIAVEKELFALQSRYPNIQVDNYVIMPNHLHILISVKETGKASINSIIGVFKSLATRKCKLLRPVEKVFQTSFYEHVIRNQHDYEEIWNYIDGNPLRWKTDCFYSDEAE